MVVCQFEHSEDSFERIIRVRSDVHRQCVVPVGNGIHVSCSEQDIAGRPLMARSCLNLERCQRWMRYKLHICYQGGDWLPFAVPAQITQSDVIHFWFAGEQGYRCMAIVKVALGLGLFDLGQLLSGL